MLLGGVVRKAFVGFIASSTSHRPNNSFLPRSMSTMSTCPFLQHGPPTYKGSPPASIQKEYTEALKKINWEDVKQDIRIEIRKIGGPRIMAHTVDCLSGWRGTPRARTGKVMDGVVQMVVVNV
jgi:hypothetical protein